MLRLFWYMSRLSAFFPCIDAFDSQYGLHLPVESVGGWSYLKTVQQCEIVQRERILEMLGSDGRLEDPERIRVQLLGHCIVERVKVDEREVPLGVGNQRVAFSQ